VDKKKKGEMKTRSNEDKKGKGKKWKRGEKEGKGSAELPRFLES
jgi:hypothetical protein